jgi:hypothetical protein
MSGASPRNSRACQQFFVQSRPTNIGNNSQVISEYARFQIMELKTISSNISSEKHER